MTEQDDGLFHHHVLAVAQRGEHLLGVRHVIGTDRNDVDIGVLGDLTVILAPERDLVSAPDLRQPFGVDVANRGHLDPRNAFVPDHMLLAHAKPNHAGAERFQRPHLWKVMARDTSCIPSPR